MDRACVSVNLRFRHGRRRGHVDRPWPFDRDGFVFGPRGIRMTGGFQNRRTMRSVWRGWPVLLRVRAERAAGPSRSTGRRGDIFTGIVVRQHGIGAFDHEDRERAITGPVAQLGKSNHLQRRNHYCNPFVHMSSPLWKDPSLKSPCRQRRRPLIDRDQPAQVKKSSLLIAVVDYLTGNSRVMPSPAMPEIHARASVATCGSGNIAPLGKIAVLF